MDQVTQQNAAMVEQSTAASHSMAQETAALSQLTSYFQITTERAPAAMPAIHQKRTREPVAAKAAA